MVDKVSGSSQPLIAGSNTVSVTCSDDAGNSATVNRTVVRDNTLPVVNITSPTDGSTTTDTSAIVTFTASDNSGAQTCSRTSGDEVPLTVGLNSITVTCVDAAGNTNSSSVNVTRYSTGPDTTAPDVDVIAPANGSTTSAASVVLAYTVLDDQDASPECTPASGDTVPLDGVPNSIRIPPSVDPPPPPTVPPAQLQSRVTPSLIFTRKAKVKGKKATVTARVWFMTPAGRAKELPCAGVVLGTTKPSGVRKALKSSKSLKAEGAACIADLSFKLPKKNVGKKIAIKLSFAGNPVLAPFSRTVKYKVK